MLDGRKASAPQHRAQQLRTVRWLLTIRGFPGRLASVFAVPRAVVSRAAVSRAARAVAVAAVRSRLGIRRRLRCRIVRPRLLESFAAPQRESPSGCSLEPLGCSLEELWTLARVRRATKRPAMEELVGAFGAQPDERLEVRLEARRVWVGVRGQPVARMPPGAMAPAAESCATAL